MSSSNENIWEELTYICPECNINLAVLDFDSSSSSTPEIINCPQCNTVASFISSTLFGVGSDDDYEDDVSSDDYESNDDSSDDSVTSIETVEISSSMLSDSSSDGSSTFTCSICLEDFVVGESAMRLPCNHLYHCDCINPWLTTHDSCPLCRFELSVEASEDDNEVTLEDVLEEDIQVAFDLYQVWTTKNFRE